MNAVILARLTAAEAENAQLRAQLAQCRALVGIMQRELEHMPPKDHRTEYGHGRADALADSLHGLVAALADLPDAPKVKTHE